MQSLPHFNAQKRKTTTTTATSANHKNHKTMRTSKTKRTQGPPYPPNGSPEEKAAGAAAINFIGYLMMHPLATQEELRTVHERLNVPDSIGLMSWGHTAEK